jgi:hypothetical protein
LGLLFFHNVLFKPLMQGIGGEARRCATMLSMVPSFVQVEKLATV